MIARPVVAGRIYSVRFRGADVLILAVNPCAALCRAIEMMGAT
jgi:hypothetical protein